MRGHSILIFLLAAAFLPSSILASAPHAQEPPSDSVFEATDAFPGAVGLRFWAGVPQHWGNVSYIQAAIAAQLEQQGLYAPGVADGILAVAGMPPDRVFHDFHGMCDVDADGVEDFLSNDHFPDGRSRVVVFSGATGKQLWLRDNQFILWTGRAGAPPPLVADNTHVTIDANGDGVCDILTYGLRRQGFSVPVIGTPQVVQVPVEMRLLEGGTGKQIWKKSLEGTGLNARTPFLNAAGSQNMLGMPSGLLVYAGPDGPEFVLKTTDTQYTYANTLFGIPRAFRFEETYQSEHIYVFDAKTGNQRWLRSLTPERNARFTNSTWITGAADLTGDGRPEVVLDQFYINNPKGNEYNNPLTGERLYQFGRGMSMMALRGEDGADLWKTLIFDESSFRPNLPREEEFQVLLWTHGTIIGDFTGDGKPDPVALYLTREAAQPRAPNGKFSTHIHPLDGADGHKLWARVDAKVQGWGYVQGLQAGPGRVPSMAIGTVDLPTSPRPAGAFPMKDVRITVLRTEDGSAEWEYADRFPQDTYLSYGLTLAQFATNLAPYDWNGDGLLDPLTPSIYEPPGHDQLMLSTQKHRYQILDAKDGSVLHEVFAWGANGVAVRCAGAENDVTVVSGHSRRLDVSRLNVTNGSTTWSEHVWVDPTLPRAASAGFDMTFLQGKCWATSDDRTLYVANTGLYSRQRGIEILPIRGLIGTEGAIAWQEPPLNVSEDILDFLELSKYQARPPNDFGKAIGVGAGSLIPGGLVGGILLASPGRRLKTLFGIGIVLLVVAGSIAPAAPLPMVAQPAGTPGEAHAEPAPPAPTSTNAQDELVSALAADPGLDARGRAQLMQKYMHESGFQAPDPARNFDENISIVYSHEVGDVNGDGNDDLVLDTYCMSDFSCDDWNGLINEDPLGWVEYFADTYCGPTHNLVLQDGRSGERLWNRSLNPVLLPYPNSCSQEYVIGTLPREGVPHVLVYRYSTTDASWPLEATVKFEHDFYLVDPRTNRDAWHYKIDGSRAHTFFDFGLYGDRAENVVVNPILQVPRDASARIEAKDVQPSLHLQAVGYERGEVTTIIGILGIVGIDDPLRVLDDYQPHEWVARLDPQTGKELWRANTFQPQPGRLVRPQLLTPPYPQGLFESPANAAEHYWSPERCCSDLNGDQVPDLVYRTIEASSTPLVNTKGPYYLDGRLVAFDGASGKQLYDVSLFKNHDGGVPAIQTQLLGDATGDGAADILVHVVRRAPEYTHQIAVIDGKTGAQKWSHESPRDLRAYVLGDANGDGGNDIAVIFWFDHPSYGTLVNGFLTNVTRTPIVAYSGLDGAVLWRTESVTAPIDLAYMYRAFYIDGMPDVNGDHVGDPIVDDPLYLPDLTVVHRQAILDGRTAKPLFHYVAAGTFAFPSRVGDVNGDGADELGLLNGDVNDLWVTLYDVQNQQALWSRRILAPRLSNYFDAQPRLNFDVLSFDNGTRRAIDLNLHFRVQTRVWSDTVIWCCDSSGGFGQGRDVTLTYTYPRLSVFDANGTVPWSTPKIWDVNLTRLVRGASPASVTYERAIAPAALEDELPYVQIGLAATAGVALGGFSLGLLFVYGIGRRLLP